MLKNILSSFLLLLFIINNSFSATHEGDLTISSDYSLTEGLTVNGNVVLSGSAKLDLNGSIMQVNGNFSANDTSKIIMQNANDRLYVEGSFTYNGSATILTDPNGEYTLTNGEIHIRGDFYSYGNYNSGYDSGDNIYSFYPSGNHKTVFDGNTTQVIYFEYPGGSYAHFNDLILENESIDFQSNIAVWGDLNSTTGVIPDSLSIDGWTLSQDIHIEGDLNLLHITSARNLDLNGHTLTVDGNLALEQGLLNINGGTLNVKGNLTASGSSKIVMENPSDTIDVDGTFTYSGSATILTSPNGSLTLSEGEIRVGGDFFVYGNYNSAYDSGDNVYSYYPDGNHTTILDGNSTQVVYFEYPGNSYAHFNHLVLENQDIDLQSTIAVWKDFNSTTGVIPDSLGIDGWTLTQDFHIQGDVSLIKITAATNIDLNGNTLTIDGNLALDQGLLKINGGILNLKGDLTSSGSSKIVMQDPNDRMNIDGNFTYSGSATILTDPNGEYTLMEGEIRIRGDFYSYGNYNSAYDSGDNVYSFYPSGNHKTIFDGNSTQVIYFEYPGNSYAHFNHLLLENQEIDLQSNLAVWGDLNSSTGIIPDSVAIDGWTLTQDFHIEGNLDLVKITNATNIDLNGYALTVDGNLAFDQGLLKVNGGALHVKGSLSASGSSKIVMQNPVDTIIVDGTFTYNGSATILTDPNGENTLTEGEIRLRGDFYSYGNYNNAYDSGDNVYSYYPSVNHRTIFDGNSTQVIYFEYPGNSYAHFNHLILENQLIDFQSNIAVWKDLNSTTGVIPDSLSIDGWTLSQDIHISGDLSILHITTAQNLDLNGYTLTVDGNFYIEQGKVIFNSGVFNSKGNFTLAGSSKIDMTNSLDFLDVYGNLTFGGAATLDTGPVYLLNSGEIHVKGNFAQVGNYNSAYDSGDNIYSYYPSGTHKLVLDGNSTQTVSFEYPGASNSYFNDLEILNTSTGGVDFLTSFHVAGDIYSRTCAEIDISGGTVSGTTDAISGVCFSDKRLMLLAHGGAIQSATVNDTVTLADISELNSASSFTIEFWANPSETVFAPFKYQVDATNQIVVERLSDNNFYLKVGSAQGIVSDTEINSWRHYAVVFNGVNSGNSERLKLYIDGIEQTLTFTGTIPSTTGDMSSATPEIATVGLLDEFRVWSSARSSDEIIYNKNLQLSGSESGLVAYYSFDERVGKSIKDLTLSAYHGSIEGNITRVNFLGDSLEFDGNNYIDIADNNTLDITSAITITAWVNPSEYSGSKAIISKNYDNSSAAYSYEILLWDTTGTIGCRLDGTSNSSVSSITSLPINQYSHIACSYDGANLKIYINGELDVSTAVTGNISTSTADLHIGYRDLSSDQKYFLGDIAEVSLWNRALSESEVQLLTSSSLIGDESGLVGYWPLNEGEGNISYDHSINGFNGTITNEIWKDTAPTIFGDTLYTKDGVTSFNNLVVLNEVNVTSYSFSNPPNNVIFDSNGSFVHTGLDMDEAYNIVATDDGSNYSLDISVRNLDEKIEISLSNYNISEHNISKLTLIDRDTGENNMSFNTLDGSNWDAIFYHEGNYSLLIETDDAQTWWYNFSDSKIYLENDGSNNFINNYSSASVLTIDSSLTNWENRLPTFSDLGVTATYLNGDAYSGVDVTALDFDGDGDNDFVYSATGRSRISWYSNNGDGTFAGKYDLKTVSDMRTSVVGDVNGDGLPDIAYGTYNLFTVGVFLNQGSQTFGSALTFSTGNAQINSLDLADIDSDGDIDILVGSYYGSKIFVLRNENNVSFTNDLNISLAANLINIEVADVDGDGDEDIVAGTYVDGKSYWLENDGSENFISHELSQDLYNSSKPFVKDMDGDSDLDLVFTDMTNNMIRWYANDGLTTSSFTEHNISVSRAHHINVADMDGDGDSDIVTSGYDARGILLNDGNGNFEEKLFDVLNDTTDLVDISPNNIAVADFDGDGDLDVVQKIGRGLGVVNNSYNYPMQVWKNSLSLKTSVLENNTNIFTVVAEDNDNDVLTYSLTGTDASLFSIDSSGVITSLSGLDYEIPVDSDSNNIYEITININDGRDISSEGLTVSIIDVDEATTDSDNDGIYDISDAFPYDIAASVDSDGDGYPDSWNSGYSEVDSTTGLLIDYYPYDSTFYANCGIDPSYDVCAGGSFGTKLQYISDYDDVSEVIDLSNEEFSFPFFGNNYSSITVSSNGYIKPGNSYYAEEYWHGWDWSVDGDSSPIIAPFWTDLYPELGGDIYYEFNGTAPNRVLTLSYIIIDHYEQNGATNTFYVEIHEDGTINFKYDTLNYVEDSTGYNDAALVGIFDGIDTIYSLGQDGSFDEGTLDNTTISIAPNGSDYLFNVLDVDSTTCVSMNGIYDSGNQICNIAKSKSHIEIGVSFSVAPSSYSLVGIQLLDANKSGSRSGISYDSILSDSNISVPLTSSMEYAYIKYITNSTDYVTDGFYSSSGTVFSLAEATPISLITSSLPVITIEQGNRVYGTIGTGSYMYDLQVIPIRVDGKDALQSTVANVNYSDGNYSLNLPNGTYKFMYIASDNSMQGRSIESRISSSSSGVIERGFYTSSATVPSFTDAEKVTVNSDMIVSMDTLSNGYNTLSYSSGWNLLSMPSRGFFSSSDLRLIFGYGVSHLVKYTPNLGWSYFWIDNTTSNPNYNRFSELHSKEGFWLNADYANSVNIPLTGEESTYQNETPSIVSGWNLIGFPVDKSVTSVVNTIESNGKTVKALWIYRSGSWYVHYPHTTEVTSTLSSSSTITSSEGIWLKVE